jgi:glycosyltransferase involved in cell wall biosynthesis
MHERSTPRRLLILAHSFNMDGRAASQTVTDKIAHLLDEGITPVVLSAVTGRKDTQIKHHQLLPWGPSGLRFDFRHLVAKKFGRGWRYRISTLLVSILLLPFIIIERLALGLTHHASWTLSAYHKGKSLMAQNDFEVIYSSGGAWSAHQAAAMLKRKTGVTWIAEIHDPMVIRDDPRDDGSRPRNSRKDRYLQKVEETICRDADHVWWFTQDALEFAKIRNPNLANKGFVVLPGAEPPVCHHHHEYSDTLNIAHFGSLTEDRSLGPVLRALEKFFTDHPKAKTVMKLHIYGSDLDSVAKQALEQLELPEIVVNHGRLETDPLTGKSGRERVIEKMYEADVLLLLHGDYEWCAEYIPSKLYEYFWARRPVVAVTNRNAFLDQLLAKHNSYICHTHDEVSILATFEELWKDWQASNLREFEGRPVSVNDAVRKILDRVTETKTKVSAPDA